MNQVPSESWRKLQIQAVLAKLPIDMWVPGNGCDQPSGAYSTTHSGAKSSKSKIHTAGVARLGRSRVRIPVTGHSEEANRDVGGVWDWDIGNGNAILLEADAGDIRVIDHMDHLVGVR